jgi:phosphatidylserine/phosphatidylglycerophosphate/cardiolipin synthase-like enzyme
MSCFRPVSGVLYRAWAAALLLAWVPSSGSGEEPETLEDLVARVGRTRWTANNAIELLADPRRAWEARLDLLESATSHLFITTFSWQNDDYGERFRFALAEVVRERRRTQKDFRVHCLADATAIGVFNRSFGELRNVGADVRSYNRATWGMAPIFDGRMHDKMIVADGRQAIVGGRNYSDIYYDPQRWWLDFGVLLEGAAVWDLQMIFLKSWELSTDLARAHHFGWTVEAVRRRIRSLWSTGRFPDGRSPIEPYLNDRFFPEYDSPPGETKVAVLYDNSLVWDRAPSIELLIELIRRAQSEVDLMTPFPNFEAELTQELVNAEARGVRVRLFVNDRAAAIRGGPILVAAYPTLIRLVESGVEVWAWKANPRLFSEVADNGCSPTIMPPVALHGKIARIDHELSIVHSSNFNIRSTYYNTEAGVAVLDRDLNRQVEDLFDGLVTLEDFDVSCTNGDRQVLVDRVVHLLGADEIEVMRHELGGRRRFLDGMSVLW